MGLLRVGGIVIDVTARTLRVVLIAMTATLALSAANVAVHATMHVCPLHLAHFESSAIVPVIYGRPYSDTLYRAARGEVALGGCIRVRGAASGLCPYCRWPAAFGSARRSR
jgi:hypothetical protein